MAKSLVCTIFNVEHGFCAFIKSPNNYGMLIDCGSREKFSPIKWVRQNYTVGADSFQYFESRRIAECIITHIHADHFSDVGTFYRYPNGKPKYLLRDKETIKFLDEKIKEADKGKAEVLKTFKKFSDEYSEDAEKKIDWGFDYHKRLQLSLSHAKKVNPDREKVINNRSFLIAISYAGKKILIPGDIEEDAWRKALEQSSFLKLVKDTNFFIASHHGHKSGFTKDILEYSGIPDIYIVSARSHDKKTDSAYSDKNNSKGYKISGRASMNHMVSTREEKKSIEIVINENGTTNITLIDASDNLSDNQASNRAKKTERLTKGW